MFLFDRQQYYFVDDFKFELNVQNSFLTVFQVCLLNNISLPCFCYHEKLSIAGNCRMCLVLVNSSLSISCALTFVPGMCVYTNDLRVKKAREDILEFLLINHPLDCPICDQGGECDLQDISLVFGTDRGRFYEWKRAVDNLSFCGPFIKTVMTRCIHCTRCIRFLSEIMGIEEFGLLGRSNLLEVGTYIENFAHHEFSGNIIDLCPVGALTSMPYAFTTRAWELSVVDSIDILDSLASSLRIDILGNNVLRVLPRLNENLNEEWITNKIRFFYDSLLLNRLYYPVLKVNSKLIKVGWFFVVILFLRFLFEIDNLLMCFLDSFVDLKFCFVFKNFFNSFGMSNFYYERNIFWDFDFRCNYTFSFSILCLENIINLWIFSLNLRLEMPLLSLRVRKNFLMNDSLIVYSLGFGYVSDLYPVLNFGSTLFDFFNFFQVNQ